MLTYTGPHAHTPAHPPTHMPTCMPICPYAHMPTCPLAHSPTRPYGHAPPLSTCCLFVSDSMASKACTLCTHTGHFQTRRPPSNLTDSSGTLLVGLLSAVNHAAEVPSTHHCAPCPSLLLPRPIPCRHLTHMHVDQSSRVSLRQTVATDMTSLPALFSTGSCTLITHAPCDYV